MLFSTPRRALVAAALALQLINFASALPTPALADGSLSSNVTDKSPDIFNRDVFSDLRGTAGNGPSLKSTRTRPAGAESTLIPIGGARLFAWHSKTPQAPRDAEAVVIVLHGVNKNANTYFKVINDAFLQARDAGLAPANTIRLAPLFMSSSLDRAAMGSNWLGWSEPSRWASGDLSASPSASRQSIFSVFDALLARYSDKSNYPNVRSITLVGHGLGAQVISRVAVLARPVGVEVRYVVANPSSQLFFTRDRPVEVDTARCSRFNEFRYGLEKMPFSVGLSAVQLFKRFAGRDVRYVIASDDTADDGDQLVCGGRSAGGPRRAERSYAYFKYIGLLGGGNPSAYDAYPGRFPALDPREPTNSRIPTSSQATLAPFKGTPITHKLAIVTGGHSVSRVLGSSRARDMMFLPRNRL